jgi:hypothetical protein
MTDTITMIANIALALSFIVGLIFGIAQVKTAARDRRERLTIQTVREFQSREFVDLMQFVLTSEMPVNREGLRALSVKEQTDLMQFGQQMESLGILVAERLINIDLVEKTLGSFVTTSWEKYQTLFLNVREVTPDPYLGEYFQWLAERIDERMREKPRQPYYLTGRSK